jgi:osmotically inducible lipoprotein OsmB
VNLFLPRSYAGTKRDFLKRREIMTKFNIPFLMALALAAPALSGCGETKGERALSGAGVGAGVGAVGGALAGGSLVTGAAIGAATGAVVGAVTDEDDINLD